MFNLSVENINLHTLNMHLDFFWFSLPEIVDPIFTVKIILTRKEEELLHVNVTVLLSNPARRDVKNMDEQSSFQNVVNISDKQSEEFAYNGT